MSAPSLTPSKAASARHAQPPVDGPPQRGGAFARSLKRNLPAHGFLIGAVLCFAFFSWYPMVREFFLAFQKTDQGEVRLPAGANPPSVLPPSHGSPC